MLQLSTESLVPSIQSSKQYHFEVTEEFLKSLLAEYKWLEGSETGSFPNSLAKMEATMFI